MDIIRQNIEGIGPCITLKNESGSKLKMYYNGECLSLENENYNAGNIFAITKKSDLYEPLDNMFQEMKEYDSFHHIKSIGGETKFEWLSDDISRNRLIITKKEFGYWVVFIKNKNNLYEKRNSCIINFNLVKSNDINIAKMFDHMFINAASYLLPYVMRKKYIKKK